MFNSHCSILIRTEEKFSFYSDENWELNIDQIPYSFRSQCPLLPPDFSSNRIGPTLIPFSTALHMS